MFKLKHIQIDVIYFIKYSLELDDESIARLNSFELNFT
jgi:hypothetical protein